MNSKTAYSLTQVDIRMVDAVFQALVHLEDTYPDFRLWFRSNVLEGLRSGERQIFVCIEAGRIVGSAIAKRSATERKLCTLWVDKSARRAGMATSLANA